MKYLVHYPYYLECNLHCTYCFHDNQFKENYEPKFTPQQWNAFREKHLKNDEILFNFYFGEPFTEKNTRYIYDVLYNTTDEQFELLTNGIGETENFEVLHPFKNRCERIGFTYHRKMLTDAQKKQFRHNLKTMQNIGFDVYVKELLFIDEFENIKAERGTWGVPVKIQDFKGQYRDWEEVSRYTTEHHRAIDKEYRKIGDTCYCRKDFKNLIIRADEHPNDVLACWFDKKVIGNIVENWFNPDYSIYRERAGEYPKVKAQGCVYRDTEKYNK